MRIIIESIPHAQQRYDTPGDWYTAPALHEYGPSTVGHGEQQCIHCLGTNRENLVLGPTCHSQPPNLYIKVSRELSPKYQQLIAVHELCEALLCQSDGVDAERVDAFDKGWAGIEHRFSDGTVLTEPGEDPLAPYHKQHVLAEIIERLMAKAMHVHWGQYGTAVDAIWKR